MQRADSGAATSLFAKICYTKFALTDAPIDASGLIEMSCSLDAAEKVSLSTSADVLSVLCWSTTRQSQMPLARNERKAKPKQDHADGVGQMMHLELVFVLPPDLAARQRKRTDINKAAPL